MATPKITDRPRKPPGRKPAGGTRRTLRLPDDVWGLLRAVAAREGLSHGGVPSEARAVAWLAMRDAERQAQ